MVDFYFHVSAGDVERFSIGAQDMSGPWAAPYPYVSGTLPTGTPAPPSYFLALDPVERGDTNVEASLTEMPFVLSGGGLAYADVSFVRPFRVGDFVTVRFTFTEIFQK